METVFLGVLMFVAIIVVLVACILVARAKLVNTGDVTIKINGDPDKTVTVPAGGKLLSTLAAKQIFIPSACGGKGSCGQCKCTVLSGGGDPLPVEYSHLNKKQLKAGMRLACQVSVKGDMDIRVPDSVFGVKKWECTVISNRNVARRRLHPDRGSCLRCQVQRLRYRRALQTRMGAFRILQAGVAC